MAHFKRRSLYRNADTLRYFCRIENIGFGHQHHELLTAITCAQIGATDGIDDDFAELNQHFVTHKIESYLIHGGNSSILARGNRRNLKAQGRGWQIALKHPLIPDLKLAFLWIRDTAVGTSGDANQFFYHQGKRYGHVLDPRSGFPVQNTLSSTILCPSAAAADALATAFFVLGPESAAEYCQQHPGTSFMIAKPGTQHRSIELHVSGIDPSDLEVLAPNIELVRY